MKTLDQAALRLAALVESSDDAIISHALDGTIETWNRAAERLFGYRAADALGSAVDDVLPLDPPVDQASVIRRLRGAEPIHHFETVAVTRDGRRTPISMSVSPILTASGELIGVSRIARRIPGPQTLERDALRLAAIVDSSDDAIVSKDLRGIVQTWNGAAERMFGFTAAEMIGQSILRIIPADRRAEEDLVLGRILAGNRIQHYETIRQRKDGSLVEISLSVSPIRTLSGVIIGASKIARDISFQRQLARAAEEANRVKDEFLATLSHELRTPLNAVMGYTHMLRSGQLGETGQERAIAIIERNATVLSQLVSDVLDVSSIVTGKVRLTISPCNLTPIVTGALDVVRPAAAAKGVSLQFEPPVEAVTARCDSNRMQQVFWNLLSNSVKFTPQGGRVVVRLDEQDGAAVVSVVDSGVGITAEALPHVFERFWQREPTPGRRYGGLGLGLALARHFVELHGGTITAASEGEGKGATFTVRLPLASAEPAGILERPPA